jgi:hypothetical protein
MYHSRIIEPVTSRPARRLTRKAKVRRHLLGKIFDKIFIGLLGAEILLIAGLIPAVSYLPNYFLKSITQAVPDKLYFTAASMQNARNELAIRLSSESDATIINVHAGMQTKDILEKIETQVRQAGTLKTLTLDSHASPGSLSLTEGGKEVGMSHFLASLDHLEKKLGKKIAERIVFMGCNTFSEMSVKAVEDFRFWAGAHQTALVGTVSFTISYVTQPGHYVQFTPEGGVIKDPVLSSDWNPLNLATNFLYWRYPRATEWSDCHIGRSFEEGAACQTRKQNERAKTRARPATPPAIADRGREEPLRPATVHRINPGPSIQANSN